MVLQMLHLLLFMFQSGVYRNSWVVQKAISTICRSLSVSSQRA